ncbi:ImmA/IrrE family metallo-endopeptidase [Ammonifex thiophilus]|uniref:ImmA/IrrE family metallo-endopeptidase n=1 Tax=Ammonifex thiophilus TaxID=444093 RepID=UPI0014041AD0|nr:ImmA/IrrE family metallo-endopeptidase [Ammonifex thiophilus]
MREVVSTRGLLHPCDLASCLGIAVERLPVGDTVQGILVGGRMLVVNSALSYPRQHAVVLHECGHRVLHGDRENRLFLEFRTFLSHGRKELEADLFALFYLLEWDRDSFFFDFGRDVFRFAGHYGLPGRAAAEALKVLAR